MGDFNWGITLPARKGSAQATRQEVAELLHGGQAGMWGRSAAMVPI